jgi:uncharacterized protein YbaR (Trm112 family)
MGLFDQLRNVWFGSRKVRLRIPSGALVLEVGSGDSPCPRSDILFDLTLESFERVGGKTVVDRPLVLGNVERLPFRDGAFDYVIAFHVLEHMARPDVFISELQRVARAGYLETPAFWAERINPLSMHRLEVGLERLEDRQRLVINRKTSPTPEPEVANQFRRKLVPIMGFGRLHPEAWVTRYGWEGRIDYRVINPHEQIQWPAESELPGSSQDDPRPLARKVLKRVAQYLHRPQRVALESLLCCPDCRQHPLEVTSASMRCPKCARTYPIVDGIPHMHPSTVSLSREPAPR